MIVSVTADLGYSTFMRQAVDSIWDHGVVMVEASNDFDSTDHQGGMFWPHVLPGNGLVANTAGWPPPLATPAGRPPRSARARTRPRGAPTTCSRSPPRAAIDLGVDADARRRDRRCVLSYGKRGRARRA